MPKPRGKINKKAAAVLEAAKGAELSDAVVAVAKELNEEVGANDVANEEEAPVKATNGRGGRGKKVDNKLVKEEVLAKKEVFAAPKGRGRGKKSVDDEVMAKEVEENAQSNGVEPASTAEEQQEETVTKGKGGSRGKRGAKAAAAKESAVENGEAKENGEVEADAVTDLEKKEVTNKSSRGRGGKKAVKDTIEDLKELEPEENTTKTQEPEAKAPTKKTGGRKKKADNKVITETATEKGEKTTFDILKEEVESLEEKNGNSTEAISEQETTKSSESEENKVVVKKTAARKKKVDDKASTEKDLENETNGKSLFDLLKEESEAAKDKDDNPTKATLEEETTNVQEPETKTEAKKGFARKNKADDKKIRETVADNETNGETLIDIPKDEDEEPPKKKGRGGRRPVAVNTMEEADIKTEEVMTKENAEVSKRQAKKGGKVEETTKVEIPDMKNKFVKKGAKAQETPKVEEVVVEKKPTKRGRGAVAKTLTTLEEVADTVATEEDAPKKRSRKESSVEKEQKPEVEKPKKGRAAVGKRKTEKVDEEVLEQPQQDDDVSKVNGAAEATEDISANKSEKTATTKRGGRKRAAPSTNKSKTDADEDTDKNAVAAADAIAIDNDETDGSKPSKTKKKKKESSTTVAAPMNATITKYNKEDFQLAPLADGTTADEPRFNLKISSWNVAGLRAWLKKEGLKFLEYEEPDIFCLQETKCVIDQLPEEVARIPGYHPYWLCMPGGYAGVAIYSKIMPINVEYGIGHKDFDDVGRVITAEYEKFFLINAYVPNSGRKLVNLDSRMKWEKLFQEFVQKYNDHKPVVICGDMNVSHQEIDLANPKSNTRSAGFTKEERDKLSELLALGYVDTFRHLYPERKAAYTYWTYMSNARARNVGWRLDYFIVSERFTKRVVDNCIRSQCMGSDHCPITLFLKL